MPIKKMGCCKLKYSIFHTSHCGSTLLACLLSKSIPTLTEPNWSHEAINIQDLWEKVEFVKNNHPKDTLVKYSSLICDVMPHLEGKKVFLYSNFEKHIKHLSKYYTDNHASRAQQEALFWAKRFTWAVISNDTLYVDSEYFLNHQEEMCQTICEHFEIEYKPTNKIDFNVKQAGYNHRNDPIEII